jgi:hypothetical protein
MREAPIALYFFTENSNTSKATYISNMTDDESPNPKTTGPTATNPPIAPPPPTKGPFVPPPMHAFPPPPFPNGFLPYQHYPNAMYANTTAGMVQQALPPGMFDPAPYPAPIRLPFTINNNSTSNGRDGGLGGNQSNQAAGSPAMEPVDLLSSDEEDEVPAPPVVAKRKYKKRAPSVKDVAAAARKKAKTADDADKRTKYFSQAEVTLLLDLIEELKPSGGSATWQMVEYWFNEEWDGDERNVQSLRNKFKTLYSALPKTGDPNCPPEVRRAKRIKNAIMYDNGVTTATEGVTNGVDSTVPPNTNERLFVGRRPGDGASSFQDMFMFQQQQSAQRAKDDRERADAARRFDKEERLAREEAADRRASDNRQQMVEILGMAINGLGQVLGGGPVGAADGPKGRVVSVLNKEKRSLAPRSPDVSEVSSKSSAQQAGEYKVELEAFMHKNYNMDACVAKGRELAVKERLKSWRETFDQNNEDPWYLQGGKAKALSDADAHAMRYVRRFFIARKASDKKAFKATNRKKREDFVGECRKDAEAIVGLEYERITTNNNNNNGRRVSTDQDGTPPIGKSTGNP